jgi:pteridine reductase
MHASDRVALVTGAGRRIGAAIARELHGAGMNVALHYRRSLTEVQAVSDELNARRPDSAMALAADLLDVTALGALAQQAHARWGRLDVLVNNASSYYPTPLDTLSAAQFEDLVGSNLRAPLFLTQACARLMGEGVVINLIDALASRPSPGFSAYAAGKAGLITLTESLARELAPRIRVNAVAPGHILWPESATGNTVLSVAQQQKELSRVPLQRLGTPEDIARMVRFLASADASYLTGVIVPVDGGLRLS